MMRSGRVSGGGEFRIDCLYRSGINVHRNCHCLLLTC